MRHTTFNAIYLDFVHSFSFNTKATTFCKLVPFLFSGGDIPTLLGLYVELLTFPGQQLYLGAQQGNNVFISPPPEDRNSTHFRNVVVF
jgi:hypothetical protein